MAKAKFVPMCVDYMDSMGDDLTVVNAARRSYGAHSTKLTERDIKLIKYMAEHGHWTPFGHPKFMFSLKVPIYIARQLMRHNVGLTWNELSRRFTNKDIEFFRQEFREVGDGENKQGSNPNVVPNLDTSIEDATNAALDSYNYLIEKGVANECARAVLPMNTMTELTVSGSYYAFIRMIILREDKHAQKESQMVAKEIRKVLEAKLPYSTKYLLGENYVD